MTIPLDIRRVTVYGRERVATEHATLYPPGGSEVLVKTRLVGICGSDVHAAAGRHPFIALPYHPGHEVVGVVAEIGSDVSGLTPGDRVVVEPNLVCRKCRYCLDGRYNLCENLAVFGCQLPGALADKFVIAADRLHRVPDEVDDSAAVLIEPLATPMHAIRLSGGVKDRSVVVLGAGSIGLLTTLACRAAGARVVVATDLLPGKRERALELGADHAVAADAPDAVAQIRDLIGGSADVVFDCVSSEQSLNDAIALAQNGGTVMAVGVAAGAVAFPLHLVQDREITIRGSAMYTGEDMRASIELIASGRLPAERIITTIVPLEQVAEAFERAQGGNEIKVVVRVDEQPQ